MASSVIPLKPRQGHVALDAAAIGSVQLPLQNTGEERLSAAIENAGLAYDARAIWLGYPNLLAASLRLLELLSADWPSCADPQSSATLRAVLRAIEEVREGMEQQENTRDQITANFLQGLGTAADDAAGITAWGFRGNTPVSPLDAWKTGFEDWCRQEKLTEVRFYRNGIPSASEAEGTRLKLLCAVAGARDVGIAARFRNPRS